ncbi:unnamed protein product [Linum trigynum]|uniref:Uncharacterized protein n=1 Tax=Linum trigynum TaxID=586398 RepID=A0AAV2E392_9ROSI
MPTRATWHGRNLLRLLPQGTQFSIVSRHTKLFLRKKTYLTTQFIVTSRIALAKPNFEIISNLLGSFGEANTAPDFGGHRSLEPPLDGGVTALPGRLFTRARRLWKSAVDEAQLVLGQEGVGHVNDPFAIIVGSQKITRMLRIRLRKEVDGVDVRRKRLVGNATAAATRAILRVAGHNATARMPKRRKTTAEIL